MIRVADYFASFLAGRGVGAAFMVSGGQMMHLIDAIARVPSMRYYCNHHEQASAMAADAYARLSGRPGLCYATGGPGGTNVLTGLVGAFQDSIPVFFLTGQCKVRDTIRGNAMPKLRQMGMFEVDIVTIVESVTKYAAFVDRAADARFHLEKAYYLATTGRPGPVLLDVPLDIQGAMIDPELLRRYEPPVAPGVDLSIAAEATLAALARAERPVILAGHGIRCSNATEDFRALVDRLGVPVVTTQLAKDLLPHVHPLFIGHLGIKGDRAANFTIQTADLLLILGCSLHLQNIGWEPELFAPSARKIHVDPDEAVLCKTRPIVTEQIQCLVDSFVAALVLKQRAPAENHHAWRERCSGWKERYASPHEPHRIESPDGPANLYEVIDTLSDVLVGHEVILTDAGQPTYIVPQSLRLKAGQRFLAPGSLAEMGWSLPAAIGAAAADPSRRVVAVIGDGSLQTNIQELQTVRHNNFNVKIVVISNDGYASIRGTQNRFFAGFYVGSSRESGVSTPNLEKIADAYGLPYVGCKTRAGLHDALNRAIAAPGPVVCEVVTQRDQEVVPAVASVRTADGRMRSAPLHLMSPQLPHDELREILNGTPAELDL